MKIQCDVCSKKEAYVFCTADEAALCDVCDHRVHHANKLASKHQRFSLLQPSSSQPPMCDICQERRALLFCQEDRAILCRECDIPLHTANEYTQKHNRFLLTGIKLSTTLCDTITKVNDTIIVDKDGGCDHTSTVPDYFKPKTCISSQIPSSTTSITSVVTNNNNKNNNHMTVNSDSDDQIISGGSTTSNISDYLIETLPGWHFDDFILDPPSNSAPPFAFSKGDNNSGFEVNEDMLSFFDVDQNGKSYKSHYTQSENLWVPQAPQLATTHSNIDQTSTFQTEANGFIYNFGPKNQEKSVIKAAKSNRNWIRDDAFTVPQITTSSGGSNKRARPFW